jgi:hypothetical protein
MGERGVAYISSLLYFFNFLIFVVFYSLGGGEVGCEAFFIKKSFLVINFFIICKLFVSFFSLSKAGRGPWV